MQHNDLSSTDALLVVDCQNDFLPGGALAVPEGDQIIPALNRWIDAAEQRSIPIIYSRDWHPPDHCSFKPQGGTWPVHCVADTEGAAFPEALHRPVSGVTISKGISVERDAYSAFDGTDLANRLREANIQRVIIGGLALDVCVRATVLDALGADFDTHLIASATRAVDRHAATRVIDELRRAGAKLITEPDEHA